MATIHLKIKNFSDCTLRGSKNYYLNVMINQENIRLIDLVRKISILQKYKEL